MGDSVELSFFVVIFLHADEVHGVEWLMIWIYICEEWFLSL